MKLDRHYFERRVTRYTPNQIEIANALYELWHPESVFDCGCGIGGYLQGFSNQECVVAGCDIKWNYACEFMPHNIKNATYKCDAGLKIYNNHKYDLVISIEVAEHIDENNAMQFCENLVCLSKNKILLTAAKPGQPGWGYINRQSKQYWIDRMNVVGATHNLKDEIEIVSRIRPIDKMGIHDNIMVFNV